MPGETSAAATIAVVDDDYRVLETLEDLLASVGYVVRLYSSGEEFLAAQVVGEVDCLISDIGMPGMSGVELLRLVRLKLPHLPVILITARREEETIAAGQELGASVFRKPFKGADLLSAAQAAIAEGRAK